MIFDRNANKPVIALLGAGSMGTAKLQRSFQPSPLTWAWGG